MTLSKAGASVHTQHYNFWYNKQICNHETFSFPHKYAETKPESTFQEKKKTGEVSWTEAPLTPNLVPLGARRPQQAQTVALLLLASQIAVWVPFLVVCDWWSRQNPWLSFINSASIAPSIKIRKSAHKDEPRALPLFTHEAPLSSVRLKE